MEVEMDMAWTFIVAKQRRLIILASIALICA